MKRDHFALYVQHAPGCPYVRRGRITPDLGTVVRAILTCEQPHAELRTWPDNIIRAVRINHKVEAI